MDFIIVFPINIQYLFNCSMQPSSHGVGNLSSLYLKTKKPKRKHGANERERGYERQLKLQIQEPNWIQSGG